MEDLTGKTFGSYQIVASLGEGGMAVVYKAYHPATGRYVALKVLPRRLADLPLFGERFRQEAKVLAQLQHPHILPMFDFGEAEGCAYIVMPLLTHGTLNDLLRGQPLPLKQILMLIAQVGDALDYAHARGIIHRDVKPGNVLLDERGNCLLTDFGLTKIVTGTAAKLTTTGAIMGTPAYMSPEQGLGEKLDGRSDIYSLGVILYEMATGRVPYKAETPMATVIKHINDPLAPPRTLNPALSGAVEQVIMKTLAKRPEDRYATASDLVQALQAAITDPTSDSTVELPSAPKPEKRPLPPEKSKSAPGFLGMPMWASVVGGLVLIGAVAGLFVLFGGGDQTHNRAATQTAAALAALVTIPPPTVAEPAGPPSATPVPPATTSPAASTQTPSSPATPTASLDIGSTQIAEKDQMVQVYVPAGEFLMGSTDSDKEASVYEKPPHTVYVDAFWIDRTEITNEMYGLCVQAGACRRPGSTISPTRSPYYGNLEFNDYPVIYVAWNEAKGYCAWAGRRLPTEAEWEKAARGTDGRIYPWGATPPSAARANFNSIKGDTTAVGSYPDSASPYGALDMAGNVAEWVSDWYLGAYYTEASAANPQGPVSGAGRVIRGGAWDAGAQSIRAANRAQFEPNSRYNFIGFRCAR